MPNWIIIVALIITFSALYVHYRGNVRHTWQRQIKDHSTYLAPFNIPIYLFSKVPNTPFFNPDDFPALKKLTDNWQIIREEGLRLLEGGHVSGTGGQSDIGFHSFLRTGWKRFHLKWYDKPLKSAQELCPKTVELLESIDSVHGAMFALLPPGSRLGEHRDPFAGSLRYHLGLRTPNDDRCFIDVDGIKKSWRDGEAMMFDETYVHYARNDTDVNRLILFADVERPMKNRIAQAYSHFFINHIMKATAAANMEGEDVGFINRAFVPFHKLKMVLKGLKRKYGWKYKIAKYTVIASVFALIFLA